MLLVQAKEYQNVVGDRLAKDGVYDLVSRRKADIGHESGRVAHMRNLVEVQLPVVGLILRNSSNKISVSDASRNSRCYPPAFIWRMVQRQAGCPRS